MNKNKLSRFLLSTSVGMIATLGISEVSAYSAAEDTALVSVFAQQDARIDKHRSDAVKHFKQLNPALTDSQVLVLANRLVLDPSGLSALNTLGDNTKPLFEHFQELLVAGVDLTPAHFGSYLTKYADVTTLRSLGVDSVRELKSPEVERVVAPAQITKIEDAVYFAEQRKDSGEFEAAAAFYLKARDLTEPTNTTKRTEFAENALLMYSEHFIHHVARVTSISEANVNAAQTLLASVKALAEATNTVTAFKRAASCAEELGTAIYDLVLSEKAARDKLTEAGLITTANTKISALYVKLYNSDIAARNMHEGAAGKSSGSDKNASYVRAADAMRLAIGALADAHEALSTAVFSGDVTVATKLAEEAAAFKEMYNELTAGVDTRQENLKKSAANSKILLSKLKATWNARARFATGTASYTSLNDQYTVLSNSISDTATMGNDLYKEISSEDRHLSVEDMITIRSVEAERLYRAVLAASVVDPLVEGDLTDAVAALKDYVVTANNNSVVDVITDMDTALKNTLSESKAAVIRKARTEANRVLAGAYGLIARARALQLEKNLDAGAADRTLQIDWLDSYLTYARLANNKTAWAAGVKAADVLLGVSAIATPTLDSTRLIKGLALTAKAEALIRDNTVASDELVAKVNTDNTLSSGLLYDANAVVGDIVDGARAQRIQGRDHLRKAFEQAVDLHSSNNVRQGLRAKWADVESAFAVDKTTVADSDLTANILLGNAGFVERILFELGANTTVANVKADLSTWIAGAGSAGAGQAGTLAHHYSEMADDPAVKIAGESVTLDELDTVEKLYNHFMEKFASIRADSAIYKGYTEAAKAFAKAAIAKADWAEAEVNGLSSVTYSNWTTKRNAAGAAYVAAVDYQTNHLRALLASSGRGEYGDGDFNTLSKIEDVLNANNGRLAAAYVVEDALKSMHSVANLQKSAASAYNQTRAAVGSDAAIAANESDRDTAVSAATTAFILANKMVRSGYEGISKYNGAAAFGSFVGERLTAVTTAYRNVVTPWLADLVAAISLTDSTTAGTLRGDVHAELLVDNAVSHNTNDGKMVGLIRDVSKLYDDAGGNYAAKHAARRDIALAYETVLKTIVSLSTSATSLDALQTRLYDALKSNAQLAKEIALTEYAAATPATTEQMNQVVDQLKERADLAIAVSAAAYGALRSHTPSSTHKTYKAARAQAITEMTGLIQEGAVDFADIVLKEDGAVATADLKAKVAHELGRLLNAKAKAERIRFDNLGVVADKDLARQTYEKAIEALKKEIASVLSQTDESLMANRNTRLMAAYQELAEAYKQAIANGASSAYAKDQHLATYSYAQILYRTGSTDRSAEILEGLVATPDAIVVHGTILRELGEQYEASGAFLKSALIYKASALQHVARKDAAGAFEAAENAMKAARQTNQAEACQAAADAFNAIGATIEFHGRVRAEAYHKAAEALIMGELLEEASDAYNASGAEWSKIGDHMQAGNQHEKAAWALSKVSTITLDQRIDIIKSVEKAAHQLQIAEATDRIEKLVDLAEDQIAKIRAVEDSINNGKLKTAVVAAAGAMYEKALAFQKDGDMSHAQAVQKRIEELVKIVDASNKDATIKLNLAKLHTLQNNHARALNAYIEAAVAFVESNNLKAAAEAYADAADAAIAAGEGSRIALDILEPMLAISTSVRAGGAKAGHADKYDVHMSVIELYRDMAKITPSAIDKALDEIKEIEKESPSQKDVITRIAGVKISLLSEKATRLSSQNEKLAILAEAKAAFNLVKDLAGETTVSTVSVKRYVAIAANAMANMYAFTRVANTAEGAVGLAHLDDFMAIIATAESVAAAAHSAASTAKMSYDVALEASKEAARAMETFTKAMLHYVVTTVGNKSRTPDMNVLRAMPERMAKVVEFGVRETLLGILKSREEAAQMQSNFAEILDATNKVTSYLVALRKSEAVRDSYGNPDKAVELKTSIATTATAIKGAQGDLAAQATEAQVLAPVERAERTDAIVAEKSEAVAKAVSNGMVTQASLASLAPAAQVSTDELTTHTESVMTAVLGNGKADKGVVGSLQKAQGGPSSSAVAIVNQRS